MDLSKHLEDNYPDLCSPDVLASINKTRTMNTPKHTAGPWIVSRKTKRTGTWAIFSGPTWNMFARVCVRLSDKDGDDPEGLANVALIGAAPELLEALWTCAEALNCHAASAGIQVEGAALKSDNSDLYGALNALRLARAAIDKATGMDSTLLPDLKGEEG